MWKQASTPWLLQRNRKGKSQAGAANQTPSSAGVAPSIKAHVRAVGGCGAFRGRGTQMQEGRTWAMILEGKSCCP